MEKLKVKDLISIGIFTAIYLVIFFAGITLSGITPYTYLFSGALVSIVAGPVFMLFQSKNGKPFAILIMGGVITTLIALMFGGMWTVFVVGYLASILAEIVFRIGKFKSFKLNTLSYILFSYWPFGVYGAFWVLKDRMIETVKKGNYGEGYAESLQALTTSGMLISMIVAVIICASLGAFLGKILLKKHFKRAGII